MTEMTPRQRIKGIRKDALYFKCCNEDEYSYDEILFLLSLLDEAVEVIAKYKNMSADLSTCEMAAQDFLKKLEGETDFDF